MSAVHQRQNFYSGGGGEALLCHSVILSIHLQINDTLKVPMHNSDVSSVTEFNHFLKLKVLETFFANSGIIQNYPLIFPIFPIPILTPPKLELGN